MIAPPVLSPNAGTWSIGWNSPTVQSWPTTPGKYDFDDTLSGHLEFCLKYEGVKIAQVLAGLEPELRERAAHYLYLAETRSSFAIEKEIPDS